MAAVETTVGRLRIFGEVETERRKLGEKLDAEYLGDEIYTDAAKAACRRDFVRIAALAVAAIESIDESEGQS